MHHAQCRDRRIVLFHVGEEGGLERSVSQFVDAKSTKEGIGSHTDDKIVATAEHARLGAAQKLISAVAHYVHASPEAVEHPRFAIHPNGPQIEESSAAHIFHQRYVPFSCQFCQFFDGRLLGESSDLEI